MIARVMRLTRTELIKLRGHRSVLIGTLLVALAALIGAMAGPSFSPGRANFFLAFSYGLRTGGFVAAFILLTSGANTLSAEFHSGTARLMLSRPVHRSEVVLGKALALLVLAAATILVLCATAAAVALVKQGWTMEVIDREYEEIVTFSAATMTESTVTALLMSLPALLTLPLVGLLVGSFIDHPAYSVGSAIGLHVIMLALAGMAPRRWHFLETELTRSLETLTSKAAGNHDAFFRGGEAVTAIIVCGFIAAIAVALSVVRLGSREVHA